MKKLKYIIMAVLITGLGLNSCTKEDDVTDSNTDNTDVVQEASAVELKVSVGDYSIAESKSNPVSDDSDSRKAFNDGDKISITADNQSDVIYKKSSEKWSPSDATAYLKWNASPMTFKAFYPAGQNDATMTTFTLPADQSNIASIQSADYMTMTSASITNDNKNVADIALTRRTALIQVVISEFVNGLTEDQKKVSSVIITSAKGDITTSPSVLKKITPYTTTEGYGIAGSVYSAIVLPADANAEGTSISIKYGTKETPKTINIPETLAGYRYTCSLKIGNDEVSFSITKEDWGTGKIIKAWETVDPYYPFTDDNFEAEVITAMKNVNSGLTMSSVDVNDQDQLAALKKITSLDVQSKSITSLKGIEYLTALKELKCNENSITELDVSNNKGLSYLSCYGNSLTELDVSKNTALTQLLCGECSLTELDVSKNTALILLNCYNNTLTDLDVSKNTALISLSCGSNSLTDLDVSENTKLEDLSCYLNILTSLDVSKNKALTSLNCYSNRLSKLDFGNASIITGYFLFCGNQTSDGTTLQNLTLTLSPGQKNYWNSDLTSEFFNSSVTVE